MHAEDTAKVDRRAPCFASQYKTRRYFSRRQFHVQSRNPISEVLWKATKLATCGILRVDYYLFTLHISAGTCHVIGRDPNLHYLCTLYVFCNWKPARVPAVTPVLAHLSEYAPIMYIMQRTIHRALSYLPTWAESWLECSPFLCLVICVGDEERMM